MTDKETYEIFLEMKDKKIKELENKLQGKVLLVEDGSVDLEKLKNDGFYVIVYRQGSTPPQFLN